MLENFHPASRCQVEDGALPSGWEGHGPAELSKTLMKDFGCGFVPIIISTVVQNVQMTPEWMGLLMSLLNPDFLDGSGGCAGEQSQSCICGRGVSDS